MAIITAIIQGARNIGFAISVDLVTPILQALIERGEVCRSDLGVSIIGITPGVAVSFGLPLETGAGITDVDSDSPTEVAGLRREVIIVRFADQPVANSGDLQQLLTFHQAGETLIIQFHRGNELLDVDVTLEERED